MYDFKHTMHENPWVGKPGKVKENSRQLSSAATNLEGEKISPKWAFLVNFLFTFTIKWHGFIC